MKLYDGIISDTMEVLDSMKDSGRVRRFTYEGSSWKDNESSEFIMQRDVALELGSGGQPSVNYTLVSTSSVVTEDETVIYGSDINEIKGDTAFARIVMLDTEDLEEDKDTEKAFAAIRNLEFVRYHVFPKGYMVRVSARSNQEQVRISQGALANGITFAKVGALYIKKYKEVPGVKKVRVIFITETHSVC